MDGYINAMRRYFEFSGRSSRSEYWFFELISIGLGLLANYLDNRLGTGAVLGWVCTAVHLVPSVSVLVRRLHDTDRSGWWGLLIFTGIGIIPVFILLCLRGTPGPNRFGPDPNEDALHLLPIPGNVSARIEPHFATAPVISRVEWVDGSQSESTYADADDTLGDRKDGTGGLVLWGGLALALVAGWFVFDTVDPESKEKRLIYSLCVRSMDGRWRNEFRLEFPHYWNPIYGPSFTRNKDGYLVYFIASVYAPQISVERPVTGQELLCYARRDAAGKWIADTTD